MSGFMRTATPKDGSRARTRWLQRPHVAVIIPGVGATVQSLASHGDGLALIEKGLSKACCGPRPHR